MKNQHYREKEINPVLPCQTLSRLRYGSNIKAGSKATPVIFWKFLDKEDAETGKTESVPMLRYYRVFNADQCEGITAPIDENAETIDFQPVEEAEKIVRGYKGS
ncbi:MAG: ArdC-like ssDNA-binding domain-containing protein, partial [Nitrospiria bacterium]